MDRILKAICQYLNIPLLEYRPLTGGDINEVFWLRTESDQWVIKLNVANAFPGMFEAEAKGLELLQKSNSFRIPKVASIGTLKNYSFLLMEYIVQGDRSPHFWEIFGRHLATMHQITAPIYGLDHDNYIGSLHQYNRQLDKASTFYLEQRLEPQFRIAKDKGYSFPLKSFFQNLENEIPEEPPSLVHGDLWNGNYLADTLGQPVLIDPAVAFAPREMDLGMMHLFGGFPESLFSVYEESYPLVEGWKQRLPIWQLYYLLVHLNLFGAGYYPQVKQIVTRFS